MKTPFSALICLITFAASIAQAAQASDQLEPGITVTGSAETTLENTIASFSLTLEANGQQLSEVKDAIAARSKQVITELQKLPLEKLKTEAIQIGPEYTYTNGSQSLVGYRGIQILSFEVDASQASEVIGEVASLSINQVTGPNFRVNREVRNAAEAELLKAAFEDAENKATILAKASGRQLGVPVAITTNFGGSGPMPYAMDMRAESAASMPMVAGSNQVSAQVVVRFALQ